VERQANITSAQAEAVFAVYKKVKALKFNVRGIELAHGGFMDKEVILRALAQAK
jgi:hypothetical protein